MSFFVIDALDKGRFFSHVLRGLHHWRRPFFELLRPEKWLPFQIWIRFYPSLENRRFPTNNGRRRRWLSFARNSSTSAAFRHEVSQPLPQMTMPSRPSKPRQATYTQTRRRTWIINWPWGRKENDVSTERQTQVTSTGPMWTLFRYSMGFFTRR